MWRVKRNEKSCAPSKWIPHPSPPLALALDFVLGSKLIALALNIPDQKTWRNWKLPVIYYSIYLYTQDRRGQGAASQRNAVWRPKSRE